MKKRLNADVQKPKMVKHFYKTILAEGFEGASIAKVAKRMKIHPSLILHYFGNKENLTLALVDFVIDEYNSLLKNFKSQDLAPEDRLTRLLEAIWSREYYEKINVAGSFAVLAVSFRNEKIHGKIKDLYRMFKKFLVREFRYLIDNRVICANDPEHVAEIIMTMIEGSRHFRAFIIDDERDDDQVRRYNQDMIRAARFFLKGHMAS
ncbi:MAG: TetR/AcrR family transcriptional regulator [Desulfobacteraceae bacterium]|nr:TetR/AcrR family transcriptional regulator [Desulfobacteraceae bacterium]MBC2756228.1 TetR/AcrR family transcriptional regulator [Desulfobacteraceae bacterium]